MKLRFVEDGRTLVWAGLLFPLAPALALWRPDLLPWLTPLLLYCSYLSGVLSHNHNHCPVFVSRAANLGYGMWLSFFYGAPSFAWIPTHNRNHHRHTNGAGDVSSTRRHCSRDTLWAALSYPLVCGRNQLSLVWGYARSTLAGRSPQRTRVVLELVALYAGHAAVLALFVHTHGLGVGGGAYLVAVALPAVLGSYWMMLTNYLQHVDCDSDSAFDHSRNFVSPFWNWFVFDNGYHTVHHQHPGLHWSRYRALHRLSAARIDPKLNHGFIPTYAVAHYLLGWARRPSAVAHGEPGLLDRSERPA